MHFAYWRTKFQKVLKIYMYVSIFHRVTEVQLDP